RAARRFGAARLAVRRFAEAFLPPRRAEARAGARQREDFFGLRERFDEDRFLEEDRFLAAMRFLLFMNVQSGLMETNMWRLSRAHWPVALAVMFFLAFEALAVYMFLLNRRLKDEHV